MHPPPASLPSPSSPPPSSAPQPPAPGPQWGMLLIGLLAGAVLSGGAFLLWDRPSPTPIAIQLPPTEAPTPALPTPTATPAPVVVYVSGAVQKPGVYTLSGSARVADALIAAGGLLPEADPNAVNQALPLWDGEQVNVPRMGETPVVSPPQGIGESRGGVAIHGIGVELVNINTATVAELDTLPGIGPSLAEAIIANRPYSSLDDLDRVPGIGPAKLDDLRDRVTVQ